MATVKKDLANVLLYALAASISDLFGVSTPAIVRRIGSALLKRAEAKKWIPKDLKDPVNSLKEFLHHYEAEGYCNGITIERRDGEIYIKSYGVFDYERIEKLALSNRHPCTILSAVAMAFLNDYFNMSVAINRMSFRLIKEEEGIEEVLNLVTVGG